VNFNNLKKLITDRSTLEIVSVLKSAIKYDVDKETDKKVVTFDLQLEQNLPLSNHKRQKSISDNEIYPEVTHSHIKINDSLELIAEIK